MQEQRLSHDENRLVYQTITAGVFTTLVKYYLTRVFLSRNYLFLSRSMASRLLGKGKFGVFDPYHTNKAIELTHGLHCAGVRKTRGASSSLLLLPVQSLASTAPAPSPVRRGRGSRDSGRDEKEQEPGGAGDRGSAGRSSNSLDSLESCGSSGLRGLSPAPPAPPPRFFSTRAAIPLMQDAFVCKCRDGSSLFVLMHFFGGA